MCFLGSVLISIGQTQSIGSCNEGSQTPKYIVMQWPQYIDPRKGILGAVVGSRSQGDGSWQNHLSPASHPLRGQVHAPNRSSPAVSICGIRWGRRRRGDRSCCHGFRFEEWVLANDDKWCRDTGNAAKVDNHANQSARVTSTLIETGVRGGQEWEGSDK